MSEDSEKPKVTGLHWCCTIIIISLTILAQMDQTKSVAYQAVDELLKAQKTHTQLKRQFAVAKLKEDLNKKRQVFENYEVLSIRKLCLKILYTI